MLIVSACLAGVKCSHDGKARECGNVTALVRSGKAVAACPEMLGGFPTPRERIELSRGMALTKSGRNVTDEVKKGASEALSIAQAAGCTGAVLKARSPSCGSGMVYDGTFSGRLVPGDGLFAAILKKSGIKVITEDEFLHAESFKENSSK